MISIRKASDRGHADHGWLNTHHTFSFADYRDPQQMGFRTLRVINEDIVAPGKGFGTHAHDNMEIISYVLSGALQHRDSMGNGSVLKAGEFQRISAGRGITHSEFNPSQHEPVHFYQIWIRPNVRDSEPGYGQIRVSDAAKRGHLRLVASPGGDVDSLSIRQDALVYLSTLEGNAINYPLKSDRHAWLQAILGDLSVNGHALSTSDGVAVSDEPELIVEGPPGSEFMLFDLA